jgi:hypothetical protein
MCDIRDVYPGSRVKNILDPGSASKNFLTPKTVSKLSKKISGMFFPDPDFSIPDPDVKKAGSRIQDPDLQHWIQVSNLVQFSGLPEQFWGSESVLDNSKIRIIEFFTIRQRLLSLVPKF